MKFDSIFGAGSGILGTIVLCDFLRFLRRVLKFVVFWSSFIHKSSFREQSNFCGSSRKGSYLEKYNFLIKKNYPSLSAHRTIYKVRDVEFYSGKLDAEFGWAQVSRKIVVLPTCLSLGLNLWDRVLSKSSRSSFWGIGVFLFLFCVFAGNRSGLNAQESSLWADKNPYSMRQNIKVGSPLYVKIKNGLQAEFELESNADETLTLKVMPDKKIIPDMPSYNSDRTITRKNKGKIKSLGKIKGNLTVLVTAVDPNTGLLSIRGQKMNVINGEENSLFLSGTVSPEFVEKDSSIDADKIADLQVNFNGKIKRQEVIPPIALKTVTNPDGSTTTKAELSEEEKQRLILNQLNRLLGESQ
ncbi:flagellar basal body L-ring protein FlgH [Leptospira borgpetersenii serovar Balcanica]|nr:flagellar basal body L-ring protein FlgH [Leptospira borgpetersenii serovar Balcanica]MBE8367711.1 flagellar basal body L-ring protein FlgH [Leptospira borgpetersenii serovar Balcanica]MBE8423869.1 flagellar basal body L-ring protein FlgH [Leptospira borgpetersenii serovar Balcanica]MBF3351026.1 flagellar basal body L-ring protein FlgH [Leptospira borgpetersenii serovar Balcanica]